VFLNDVCSKSLPAERLSDVVDDELAPTASLDYGICLERVAEARRRVTRNRRPISMRVFKRIMLSCVPLGGLLPSGAFAQSLIRTQNPCVPIPGEAHCFTFADTDPISVIRGFSLTVPSAGRALLTFNKTLYCRYNDATSSVVDLVSQIVTDVNAVPDVEDSEGLHHAIVLAPPNPSATSDSFNLASTREVRFAAAGTKTLYFKLAFRRMDPGTRCFVYNAAFSAVFVP
jgi:hypothetical protein